ncbi:glucose-1-phosphate cytidylyltransferase [Aliiroseovarius sp. KMU-50]|uniref:Glucose-1-phosphate cytidylyltransferase n=1 Tax=Aliiroseovarius salicola TaxID=3009082 RepID=A0ABT4W5H5_9RHOB|nr:glucose-1-phosphate cytidylyltransferase [Aliiroseovarius sp. KMU-50]MDA5095736.1 glucose-1-phosphate cytidylyltransferase [Aliiroseovarius sp. KMU-50]
MQVAILCGGLGTRIREETELKPKPMIEIGRRPILWHIMQYYSSFGHNDFVLCTGYKSDVIKQYFLNYRNFSQDIEIDLRADTVSNLEQTEVLPPWKIRIQNTGIHTQTGSRLKQAMQHVDDDLFLATYGDGVANIDISAVVAHHKQSGKLATVTAVRPSSRFGELAIEGNTVTSFSEKPQTGQGWINGGFFVFHRSVFERLPENQNDIELEKNVLEELSEQGELSVYRHDGFWQCMDTSREMELLETYWENGNAPWKRW